MKGARKKNQIFLIMVFKLKFKFQFMKERRYIIVAVALQGYMYIELTFVWGSWQGTMVQATGWIGSQLRARNGLQRVCTISRVLPGTVCTPRFLQGQTKLQSVEVCVAAWW